MLWQERGVINTVVVLGVSGSLGVYQKEVTEGNTINNRAIYVTKSKMWHYVVLGVT